MAGICRGKRIRGILVSEITVNKMFEAIQAQYAAGCLNRCPHYVVEFLIDVYLAGPEGVPVPVMDVFKKIILRDLWFSRHLCLRGNLVTGHGTLFITEKGRKFVDAHKEDWPLDQVTRLQRGLVRKSTQGP